MKKWTFFLPISHSFFLLHYKDKYIQLECLCKISVAPINAYFVTERCDNNRGGHPAAHSSSDRFNHITSREELNHQRRWSSGSKRHWKIREDSGTGQQNSGKSKWKPYERRLHNPSIDLAQFQFGNNFLFYLRFRQNDTGYCPWFTDPPLSIKRVVSVEKEIKSRHIMNGTPCDKVNLSSLYCSTCTHTGWKRSFLSIPSEQWHPQRTSCFCHRSKTTFGHCNEEGGPLAKNRQISDSYEN